MEDYVIPLAFIDAVTAVTTLLKSRMSIQNFGECLNVWSIFFLVRLPPAPGMLAVQVAGVLTLI